MKKNVKGFTLIELIVVMAIFGIILASAMSLLPGVMKIMLYSDAQDSGSAGVSDISAYLENELSSVEYLDVYNTIGDPGAEAQEFAKKYYEGVLKNGSTVDSATYGKGTIHVLEIDNTNGGRIMHYDYDIATFDPTSMAVALRGTPASPINEARYERTTYNIQLGTFDGVAGSGTSSTPIIPEQQTYEKLSKSLSVDNTTFTINCTMEKGSTTSPKLYSFSSTASLSLINIRARMLTTNTPGVKTYFGIKENASGDKIIASITDNDPTTGSQKRSAGAVDCAYRLFYTAPPAAPASGTTPPVSYTFVYSYAPEIKTN